MADYAKILAANVKAARERLGLSQAEFAHQTGIDRTYVRSLKLIVKLANGLEMSPGELLTPPKGHY
jgi:transcriptional regulator with XRE-family HTH domain